MKKITKLTVLISVFLVLIISFVLLKSCGNTKVDKSGFYNGKSHIAKTSTQNKNNKKTPGKTEKSSSSTDKKTSNSSSIESSNEEVQGSNSVNQAQDPNTVNQGGAWKATSGSLELDKDTPVYAEPNKESGVVYTHSKGKIDWSSYFYENGEWWYMFREKGGDEATTFYISYSDVNH